MPSGPKDIFLSSSFSTLTMDWASDLQEASSLSDTYFKNEFLWAGARLSF